MNFRADLLNEATTVARDAVPSMADLAALSDDDLLAFAARAEELGRVADALRLAAAGEVAERSRSELGGDSLARRRGCTSAAGLLERLTLISAASARTRVRTALGLRPHTALMGETLPAAFPLVSAGVLAGDLGADAAAAIVAALAPIRDRVGASDEMDAAEQALIDAAYGSDEHLPSSADDLRIMAQTWALYLDPDGALPDEQCATRLRRLSLGRERDGLVPLRGDLLPEVAAQLQKLFDAILNPRVAGKNGPEFHDDTALIAELAFAPDQRSAPQERHDAFQAILLGAARVETMPLLGGAAPTLVVTVAADQLDRPDGIAFLAARGDGDTGAVGASTARHIGCAGQIQRIVFGRTGGIVELGSPQRIFTAHQRRAIAARDGECIIPGCHVPAAWAEVHHVDPAARGGPTHTHNGVLLCWWHHHTLESGGWAIKMVEGYPWVRAPRWIDPAQTWRRAGGSPQRRLSMLTIRESPPPTPARPTPARPTPAYPAR